MTTVGLSVESWERWVKVLRELALLLFILYIGFLVLPFIPKLLKTLEDQRLTEFELPGGFKAKLAEVSKEVQGAARASVPQATQGRDEIASESSEKLFEALTKLNALTESVQRKDVAAQGKEIPQTGIVSKPSYWVYLGELSSAGLKSDTFKITRLPEVDEKIVAKTRVYKRQGPPVTAADGRHNRDAIGLLNAESLVTVKTIDKGKAKGGQEYIWAEVF